MFKYAAMVVVLLTMSLSTAAAQEIIEPKLYTFRLGKAIIQNEKAVTMASIRFYTPNSLLNWIPTVKDLGLMVGITVGERRTRYMVGVSYELNRIVDFNVGACFKENATSKLYAAISLDLEIFHKFVDVLQAGVR